MQAGADDLSRSGNDKRPLPDFFSSVFSKSSVDLQVEALFFWFIGGDPRSCFTWKKFDLLTFSRLQQLLWLSSFPLLCRTCAGQNHVAACQHACQALKMLHWSKAYAFAGSEVLGHSRNEGHYCESYLGF